MMEDPYYTDSLFRPDCIHFRLRLDKNIVGYMQVRPGQKEYYSTDNFWWRSTEIKHNVKDRSTEMYDINRQMIFEHDLIQIRPKDATQYTKRGLVQWDEINKKLILNLLEENKYTDIHASDKKAPFRDDVKITGQLFD